MRGSGSSLQRSRAASACATFPTFDRCDANAPSTGERGDDERERMGSLLRKEMQHDHDRDDGGQTGAAEPDWSCCFHGSVCPSNPALTVRGDCQASDRDNGHAFRHARAVPPATSLRASSTGGLTLVIKNRSGAGPESCSATGPAALLHSIVVDRSDLASSDHFLAYPPGGIMDL